MSTILEVTELTTIAKQVIGLIETPKTADNETESKNSPNQSDEDLVLGTNDTEEGYTEEYYFQEKLYKCEACEKR